MDIIGAIFLGINVTAISRTKQVDIRSKYVHEYQEDGAVKIIFC